MVNEPIEVGGRHITIGTFSKSESPEYYFDLPIEALAKMIGFLTEMSRRQ